MKLISKTTSLLCLLFFLLLISPKDCLAYLYREDFDTLNSNKWGTSGATGSIFTSNGSVFLTPPPGRYSTYLYSKSPIVTTNSNYKIELNFAYTSLNFAGSGIVFGTDNPDYPVELTDPVDSRIFTVWQDLRDPIFGVFDKVSLGKFFNISSSSNLATNKLVIENKNNIYNLYFNEGIKYSATSTRAIRHVWFGNPGPADSDSRGWNHMRIDSLYVNSLEDSYKIDLHASTTQLPFDRTAELTATVRDGNGNVVANKLVEFSAIEGRADFAPGSVMTDAQGRAKTVVTPNSLNNLRVSAEVEGITGEFAFEVYRPKILIIPGHGASYNSLEVMTGIESENWHWFTDVSRRSWDDVVTVLREAGLQEGRDFEFVFYDWRKSLIPQDDLVSARDRFLIPKLDQMLSGQPGGRKVNILAHSFGGLVTRSLVEQSERASKINRIITFGTPHRGASNAYYGWEGGKAAPIGDAFYRSSVFAVNHLAHKLVGYPTRAAAMRKTMPSVAELLPKYSPYIYRMDNNIFLNTSDLVLARNPLIDEVLKMDRFKNRVGDFGIVYRAVVSDSNETIYDVKVKPHLFPNEWEDGYAHDYGLKNGDNTVPISSADLGDGYSYFQKGAHADLPDEAVGFIKEQFRIAAVAPAVGRTAPRRVMGVLMFSPAYAEIYNSAGEKISESFPLDTDNHNFVYASDFADGIVTIRVTGTANGSYQTYINFADDGVYKELELSGTITQGEVKLYEFLVDTNQENFSELVETTLHTIPGALVIRGSNLLTTLRFEVPRDFQTEQLQKEWVRVNGKELAIKEVEITRNNKHVLVKVPTIDLLRLLQTPKTRMDLTATLFGETQSLRGKRSLIVQR